MGKLVKNNNNNENLKKKKALARREYSGRAEGTDAAFVRVFEFWGMFSGVGVGGSITASRSCATLALVLLDIAPLVFVFCLLHSRCCAPSE